MEKIKKQSEFSRARHNEAKMGAYYTDSGHCRRIGKFLEFPKRRYAAWNRPSGTGRQSLP